MSERPTMSRAQIEAGFAQGRTLTQEEWSSRQEIQDVDDLIAAGKAEVIRPWGYHDNFQCSFRKVRGRQGSGA